METLLSSTSTPASLESKKFGVMRRVELDAEDAPAEKRQAGAEVHLLVGRVAAEGHAKKRGEEDVGTGRRSTYEQEGHGESGQSLGHEVTFLKEGFPPARSR